MYDRNELLKALNIIFNICKESKSCSECPLTDNARNKCYVSDREPIDWEIKTEEETVWRAFYD